jgi:hypothetical protein
MARTVRTARDLGIVPADIEDSVDEAEKSLRANNFGKLIDQHPAIGQWAAGDPRGAVAASDDTKSLGILGSAWDMFKRSKNPVLAFAAGVDAFDRADVGRYANGGAPGLIAGAPALLATAAAIMGDPVAQAAMPSPRKAGQALASAAPKLGQWVTEPIAVAADFTGVDPAKNGFRKVDKFLADTSDAWMPKGNSWVEDQILAGIANVPGTLASMTLGAGLRAAGASLRTATVASVLAPSIQQGGESYFTAREQGAGRGVSAIYGILDTAAEAGGEYLGQREFLDTSHKGRSILTRWFRSQIPDVLGEGATTVAENTTAWLFQPANKDKTLADLAKEMPESMAATAIQSLVGGGLSHVTISGLETALDTAAARKRAEVRDQLGDRIAAAVQGVQDAAFIDQVERAAKGSKLNARDPETYAALMRQLANDNEVENVFVPAEAIVAYQQSDSYDQFDDPFADYQGQINEALATGGDVVLPAEFALARLPGTTAWDAVRDDLRLRPGGMSMREAQELQQNLDAHIKEASDRAASSDQADATERDQRIAMVEARTQELQNAGFSPRIAGLYAELDVLRAAVRAQRNGRPLDPQDFGSAIRAILPLLWRNPAGRRS